MGRYVSSDSTSEFPLRFNDYWGRWTEDGVHGDPTTATAEKGKVIFEAVVSELVKAVEDWQKFPIAPRSDQHTLPVQSKICW
jgi:creatinine amidohydrolase/Fe(II)-dependent formamide hydrolase-like protein